MFDNIIRKKTKGKKMCRILSVVSTFENPISNFFLRKFVDYSMTDRILGYSHRDGWGVAWMENDEFKVFRSTKPIWEELDKINGIKSNFFLIHARKATVGSVSYENTHPFYIDDVVFAHNGQVELNTYPQKYKPIGETDSEKFLDLILEFRDQLGDLKRAIMESLKYVRDFHAINFVLASLREKKVYVLNYYNRIDEPHNIHYTMYLHKNDNELYVSSEPLESNNWSPLSREPFHPVMLEVSINNPNNFIREELFVKARTS